MDIRVFDKQLNALGVIDEMESLIWSIRYFSVGEAKVLAPVTSNNRELLKVGNLIVKHDEYIDLQTSDGRIWRRAAEITYVHYAKDDKGQEQIEAVGSLLGSWLNQRVIYPQVTMTGTMQQIVNQLIAGNVGANATAKRKFTRFEVLPQETIDGNSIEYASEDLKALGDEVRDVCQSGKIGYEILICEAMKVYGFYLYKGADLTGNNTSGNPPCIFSRDYDNVVDQEYEDDAGNVKNYAYVRGAPDSNQHQEVVQLDRASTSGLDLYEVLVDATDIQRQVESGGTQQDIPVAQYRAMLTTKGDTELDSMIEAYSFNSTINMRSNLMYKQDFDLGDRITCVDKTWGITINSRITEITQTYERGKAHIEATFGESSPTLLDQIKKVR